MQFISRSFCIRLLVLCFGIIPFEIIAQEGESAVKASAGQKILNDTVSNQEGIKTSQLVLTGYTNQIMKDIIGSMSFAEPELMTAIPSGNVPNQLQGRMSGVTVTGSGQPGMTSKVRIRGLSSFQNNNPLYIVDGVPSQDISLLNPNDIVSLCVLKDAGAAAIYGSRASSGVIVIKTKSGDKGLNIGYNMYIGAQFPGDGTSGDVLNTQEYGDLQWLVYENDGNFWDYHPIYGQSSNPEPSFPSWAADTDWYDEITDRAGIMNHDLEISGGTDNAKFYSGFGYFRQDGIVIHTNSERYNARFNSEYTFFKNRVKLGENLNYSFHKNLSVPNLNENSPIHMGPYRSQSIIPVIVTEPIAGPNHNFVPGEWGGTGISSRLGNAPNEVAVLTRDKDDKYWNTTLTGSAYINITIKKGLNFRSTFGGSWNNGYGMNYTIFPYEQSQYYQNPTTSNLKENSYYGGDWNWTNLLTFDRTFGQHEIVSFAGYEASMYGAGHETYAQMSGYFSDAADFRNLSNGVTMDDMGSNSYTPTRVLSTFIKADYGFSDRYHLSTTLRRDGCSRFGKENRYGFFPSVAAGWRISNESFFEGIGWIDDLKIRGSYGITGNQLAVSPQSAYILFSGDIAMSYYDINGTSNSAVIGYYPSQIANPDIKWETTAILDIGFDSRLWNDRIGIIFDWYQKKSEDLIYKAYGSWYIPGTIGETDPPFVNSGSMKNSGVDVELNFKNAWGDFCINSNLIFSAYKNEITGIADGSEFFNSGEATYNATFARNMKGHPMSSFYGYIVEGLFQNENEIQSAPGQSSARPGLFRFANVYTETSNYGNEQWIDSRDKTIIGDPNPDFTYAFDLGLSYKNFDLNIFFYGSHGNDILNWNKWYTDFWPSSQGQKSHDLLYNSWTPENTKSKTPMATSNSNFSTNEEVCSYYIEDGSYLRLKSLQIGYTIPETLLGKAGIKSLRFYLQGINLFTITKYSGLDPEIGGPDTCFGVDRGNYPNVRQFILGINLAI